ncbi:hypothetical protein AMATHDRAFT_142276 [Amanita thiersii Skay4041]|uniref:Flavin reductase like domain-containing protein n=1 Tax=Amanita thiersii Skay4041 TaxID=703135 RepID=A0A2A9NV66_9AGAR|nr:hypothetical protein AMATHDRAFT_142276 [Amanita thiersii Skay4041]
MLPCLQSLSGSPLFSQLRRSAARSIVVSAPRHIQKPPAFNKETRFTVTEPPHPEWEYGKGLPEHEKVWKQEGDASKLTWDLTTMVSKQVHFLKDVYPLLTSAIIPRPVAFVSTLSSDGIPNLAPFRCVIMCNQVGHNPPMLSVSFALSRRRPKDTRENILATKEFTVNIISESFVEAANTTSVESPVDMNEWVLSGLTMEPSIDIKPSFVRESAVSFECKLYSWQDIFGGSERSEVTATFVLGEIKRVHARRSVMHEDGISLDAGKLRPISRLGGNTFGRLTEGFELPRVSWKAVKDKYELLERGYDEK